MKKTISIFSLLLVLGGWACNDDESIAHVTPEATGTLVDDEGNEYGWVRYNGLDWMTSNFREGTPYYDLTETDSWGDEYNIVRVDNEEQAIADYELYGNLYTYEDAVRRAPEGWRLPTDEDWQRLEQALGMSSSESVSEGWRGSEEGILIQQDESGSGIHLLCGGYVNLSAGNYNDFMLLQVRESGYYWSSTVDSTYTSAAAYYRRIRPDIGQIERETIAIHSADHLDDLFDIMLSVRYVRDAQE